MSNSLRPHGLWLARLLYPCDSPGKNTGVGCHSLLQEIFPTQGWNPGLLHCRQILHCLSYKEDPVPFYGILQMYQSEIGNPGSLEQQRSTSVVTSSRVDGGREHGGEHRQPRLGSRKRAHAARPGRPGGIS